MSDTKKNKATVPAPKQNIATSALARWVLISAGLMLLLLLLVMFLWYAVDVLLLLFAGVLVAILLRSLGDLTAKFTGFSPKVSLFVAILLLLALGVGLAWIAAPPIMSQVNQLSERVPQALTEAQARAKEYPLGRWLLADAPAVDEVRPDVPQVLARARGVVTSTVGAIFGMVIVLFVGVYLAVDPLLYTNGALRLVPQRHRPRGADVLAAVGYTLRWWLIGQLITMLCVGLLTMLGLWALGIPLAMILGLLAALLEFIPNFGPVIAAVPAVLLAMTEGAAKAGMVVGLYVVVQQIESMLISPLVHQKTVKLPPVLTILAQVFLGIAIGPLGLLLATPLMAVVLVVIKLLYVEQTLGDSVDTPLDEIEPEDKPPVPPSDGKSEEKPEQPPAKDEPSDKFAAGGRSD